MEAVLQALANGVVSGTLLAVPALGFSAIFAVLRFPNFAIGALATAGAYGAWLVNTALGAPVAVALAVGFVVAGIVGTVVEFAALERLGRGGHLMKAIGSLAIGMVLENVIRFAFGNDLRAFDLPLARDVTFGPIRVGPQQLASLGFALAVMAAVWAFLALTSIGRSMRAVADNPDLALVSGVRPDRVMVALWSLVGAVTAVAGMMVGMKTVVSPELGWEMLLPAFAATILGGIGSPAGAVLAGLMLGVVQELSTPFVGFTYKLAVPFAVLLAVLLVRPRGLFGRLEGVR